MVFKQNKRHQPDEKCNLNDHDSDKYEIVNHGRFGDYRDCKERLHHSMEIYTKMKKNKLYENDVKTERHELGHGMNKKDHSQVPVCRAERDSKDRYDYDPNRPINLDRRCKSYFKNENQYKKLDKSYYRKAAMPEPDTDYYADSEAKLKNDDHNSRSRKQKRSNHNLKYYHRDSQSRRLISDDDNAYLSNKHNNSEHLLYVKKDRKNLNSKRNENKGIRGYYRNETVSREEEKFATMHCSTNGNHAGISGRYFNPNARNKENDKTKADSDMHNEKDKEASPDNDNPSVLKESSLEENEIVDAKELLYCKPQKIGLTERKLSALRRDVYLTIKSSLDFPDCTHNLLKLDLAPAEIPEMCCVILNCCAEERTYEKFYGLLAENFCKLNQTYVELFMDIFRVRYKTIHWLRNKGLRNVATFFAHLLHTDSIHWMVFSSIKLTAKDSTSSGRVFLRIILEELTAYMGIQLLSERVMDETLQEAFEGIFPCDDLEDTRFAVHFFTSIGLGDLVGKLQQNIETAAEPPAMVQTPARDSPSEDDEPKITHSQKTSSSPKNEKLYQKRLAHSKKLVKTIHKSKRRH